MNEVNKIAPKKIPFKCVVCNGWGTVSTKRIQCHACNGKGYILIDNSEEPENGK